MTSPPEPSLTQRAPVLGPPVVARVGLRRSPHPAGTRWLDLARIVAIPAVVLIHVLVPVVLGRTTQFPSAAWWTAATLSSAARWSVPVFVMVSGALLLDPRRDTRLVPFLTRRLRRVGIPLVVWTVVYLLFQRYYLDTGLTFADAKQAIYAGSPALQLYFLFIIVGLYLLTPFLRVFTMHASWQRQAAFVVMFLGIGILDEALRALTDTGGVNAATRFLPYVGYYVAGWVLRDVVISRRLVTIATVLFVGSIVLTTVRTRYLGGMRGINASGLYLWDYLSPPVTTMSLSAFVLIRALAGRLPVIRDDRRAARLRRMADLTFGVYLVHMLILKPISHHVAIPAGVWGMVGVTAAVWVVVVLASALATAVAQRVPVLRAVF
jgi:surface polysaccharide O-acyltransferase-like enzyme